MATCPGINHRQFSGQHMLRVRVNLGSLPHWIGLLACVLLFGGCSTELEPTATTATIPTAPATAAVTTSSSTAGPQSVAATKSQPLPPHAISAQQATEFGLNLEMLLMTGKYEEAEKCIDWDALMEIATAKPDAPALQPLRKRFKADAAKNTNLFLDVGKAITTGSRVKFLRADDTKQPTTVLFNYRQGPQGGLNYQRMILGRNAQGKIVVHDIYVMMTGENLSEIYRRG